MNDVLFSKPVRLNLNSTGERQVASSWEALECMREQWPEWARGQSYRAAYRVCRDALDGWRGSQQARKAFLKAARRAGLIPANR
jgi:hypothetical protein